VCSDDVRGGAEGVPLLSKIRQLLGYHITVAELIGLAVIVAAPYLLVGVILVDIPRRAFAAHARHRPGGVVPGLDRVLAGAAVLRRVHDMTAETTQAPLSIADTQIHISHRAARWDEPECEREIRE
jgi:hypothetical protein